MLSPIPYYFIKKPVQLTWADALWGYEHQMIGWNFIVDMAMERVSEGSCDPMEIELASLTKTEAYQVGDLLRQLANSLSSGRKDSALAERKWLYLQLAWLYENRHDINDPLGEVEEIYADFDYPVELEDFVRYMPPVDGYDPTEHTTIENEERLFNNWRKYLETKVTEFQE